jgi:hypothetical protein
MKERPILFSTEMVRAILDGRKTQTRRILKVPKSLGEFHDVFDDEVYPNGAIGIDTSIYHNASLYCPYGKVGDLLWVKETFCFVEAYDGYGVEFKADDKILALDVDEWSSPKGLQVPHKEIFDAGDVKWRPSIFMPRVFSRITLEITNIRVERVQEISESDAEAEGFGNGFPNLAKFRKLWNEINSKRGFSWESNPFVWVIEFKVLEGK